MYVALNPTLQAAAQIAGGLGGLLGKKKKSALQKSQEGLSLAQANQAQALIPGQTALYGRVMHDALTYDPEKAMSGLVGSLEASGTRMADLGQRGVMGAVARSGGNFGGDTNVLRLRQRALDSATSPVMMQLAQIRAQQPMQALQMRLAAARGAPTMGGGYMGAPQQEDNTAGFDALSQGLSGLLGVLGSKKKKGA